jgi:hypothetical protein
MLVGTKQRLSKCRKINIRIENIILETVEVFKLLGVNIDYHYFNIELKRTKLTSQTDTKLLDMNDLYRLRVLLPKRQQIFPR